MSLDRSFRRTSGRRLAILIPTLGGGGAERVSVLLSSGFLDSGCGVDLLLRDLVCSYPDDLPAGVRLFFVAHRNADETRRAFERLPVAPEALTSETPRLSFRFPRLALSRAVKRDQLTLMTSSSLPSWAVAIGAYIDRQRPDAILAMLTSSVAAATMGVRIASHRVRTVAVLHNVFRSRREIRRARRSYPHADAAVGVSLGVSSELARYSGVSHDQLHTVYNPAVPADLPRLVRETPAHRWIREPGPPLIISAGRLHRQKDFPSLLAAFAQLLAQQPARLIVLGEGPERSYLLRLAHELGISEHIDFPGFVGNPYAYMARARLFVLSSRHEGLPTVLIEAMACGCPVVSTDCPFGPDEILERGRWGELVPVGDPPALAGAMTRALNSSPRKAALRKRASFFSLENAVTRYKELLFG